MKQRNRAAWFLAVLASAALALGVPAFAEAQGEEDEGIPAYALSRLKILAGTAWLKTAEDGDWQEATTNTPVTANSRVSVPEGSEAELQFHGGQFVLLTSGTDVEVREMSEDKTYFRLRSGEIRFDLPGDDFAPVTVRVPGGARANFAEPGRYWLDVTDEDTTRLVVRRGKATVSQEGEKYRLNAGQEASIGRTITVAQYRGAEDAEPPREVYTEEEQKAGVPPVVAGELRDYGDWVYVQQYGYVWRPRVVVGWTPYYYGRWAWVAPYGWTWVSYEPWGWYPYLGGYWVNDLTFGWVWTPYGSWISVGFVWGSYDYYHRHPYYYHRNYRYRPNARFIPEGRNVRWEPMRPGERYRRPSLQRDDARLRQFDRPLERNRVFMATRAPRAAGASSSAPAQRQWRDVTAVRAERQQAVRSAPPASGGVRKDTRPVRPEMRQRSQSVEQQRPSTGVTRPSGTRSGAPQQRVTPSQPAAPRAPSAPSRESAPRYAPSPSRESAPAPSVAPSRESAPARESAPRYAPSPSRESAPAPSMAPSRESAPSRDTGGGSRGGVDRGGGGWGGGGDRGGGGGGRGVR